LTRACAASLVALAALIVPAGAQALRPIPDTEGAVHVWNDQLPDSMSDAQIRFVATHIDGTQKVSRQTASRLRAFNPGCLVLHYRLGIGDGPVPFRIGDRWASDYGSVNRFMRYEERRLRGRLWFIPNAGSWITTRDRTDYAIPRRRDDRGLCGGRPRELLCAR
jgi:hypothetical protein